jgi:hypothetical protein
MSTTTMSQGTTPRPSSPTGRSSPARRFFGVVTEPQSYRNLAYLLLSLPLGTAWFVVLIGGLSVAVSMVVVALLGIPMLLGLGYVFRSLANVERRVANVLLGYHLAAAPQASFARGNVWVRLRSMCRDRGRWRELGYLLARFPVGIATFTVAVTALATPVLLAYAPFAARYDHDHPFGSWSLSSNLERVASSSPWSWFIVPLGVAMLIVSFHIVNILANACGRWTAASLGHELARRPLDNIA